MRSLDVQQIEYPHRGRHERQGRHEAPRPEAFITFNRPPTDEEFERIRRGWESLYAPTGTLTFTEERKSFMEAFWEAYRG